MGTGGDMDSGPQALSLGGFGGGGGCGGTQREDQSILCLYEILLSSL